MDLFLNKVDGINYIFDFVDYVLLVIVPVNIFGYLTVEIINSFKDNKHKLKNKHDLNSKPIGVIILAAGLSSRMGQFKLLLNWLDDKPILVHIVEKVLALSPATVIVVTGHRADDVRQALSGYDVTFAHNADYADGEILSSMKVGLRAMPDDVRAAMVVPADLPRIPVTIMQDVIAAHEAETIIAPRYEGQRGHPVLLDRYFWQAFLDLPADGMPRDVLQANKDRLHLIDVNDDGILADVDTPQAYQAELRRAQQENSKNSD